MLYSYLASLLIWGLVHFSVLCVLLYWKMPLRVQIRAQGVILVAGHLLIGWVHAVAYLLEAASQRS